MTPFLPSQGSSAPDPTLAADGALAQALASRICHDLVGPVGAVVNGVDLLRETGGGAEEAALIGDSAGRAAAVLAFHRLAFGAAGAEAGEIGRADLLRTVEGFIASRRIAIEAEGAAGPALPRADARLAALMALCVRGVLGLKGTVGLVLDPGERLPIRAEARCADPAGRPEALAWLEHASEGTPAPALSPQYVEFALLAPAARAVGARLALEREPETLRLAAQPA